MENVQQTLQGWAEDAKKNAGMIMLLGVVTVIAGFLALVMPWAGVVVFVGLAMLVGGPITPRRRARSSYHRSIT